MKCARPRVCIQLLQRILTVNKLLEDALASLECYIISLEWSKNGNNSENGKGTFLKVLKNVSMVKTIFGFCFTEGDF